jgi:hypothetical protein
MPAFRSRQHAACPAAKCLLNAELPENPVMRYANWIGLLAAATLVSACYQPWIEVPSVHLQIGGMAASGKHNFGQPGLLHLVFAVPAAVLFMLPFVWAKRTNLIACGLNIAWALRNYILLSKCYGGDCPVLKTGLYLVLAASVMMLIAALFPDIKMKEDKHS